MPQRSILITGCSSGIGLDAARTLAERGWRVFASCRKREDCDRLEREGLSAPLIDYEDAKTFAPALDRIAELGWQPQMEIDEGLERTVAWYRDHDDWWRSRRS